MRFFRFADAAAYDAARLELDRARGYPNAHAQTTIDPAATAPRDAAGRVLLAAAEALVADPATAALLADLEAAGVAEEITPAEYVPEPPALGEI